MKTTCNWLREYCDHGLPPDEVARRLTMAGLSVEGIEQAQGGDFVLEAEVTANRADQLSAIGIARELAALLGKDLRLPKFSLPSGGAKAGDLVSVKVLDAALCPRYTARVITGVKVGHSPSWLAERLASIGVRPVNNVVDITNYVLFECGQPLHAFDLDRLAGREIIVRRARAGEKLTTIDGRQRELGEDMLVIADARGPVAVAGVMGGLETEVSQGTRNILLESAQFDGGQIRRASRKLGLSSDSSYRFERGVDPVGVEWGSGRAAALMAEFAGGAVADGIVDIWPKPVVPRRTQLRISRMNRLLGMQIPIERAVEALRSLGFTVAVGEDVLEVVVPSFRGDVSIEPDLIEEVARIYGYDKVPDRTQLGLVGVVGRAKTERICDELRALLSGAGFHEAITASFADEAGAAIVSPWTNAQPLRFNNTIRSEDNLLRVSILPGLLRAKAVNLARGITRAEMFEIGAVFLPVEGEKLPREQMCLAILEEDGFRALKGTLDAAIQCCGLGRDIGVGPCANAFFEPGHGAQITAGGGLLSVFGELNGELSETMGFRNPPALAEVNLDLLTGLARLERRFSKLPVYPSSSRDVAVIVDESATWEKLEECVRGAAGALLESVNLFDLYRGKQVPAGKKSLAFTLTFRAPDRTLTGQEVDAAWFAAVAALEGRFGATLRAT